MPAAQEKRKQHTLLKHVLIACAVIHQQRWSNLLAGASEAVIDGGTRH